MSIANTTLVVAIACPKHSILSFNSTNIIEFLEEFKRQVTNGGITIAIIVCIVPNYLLSKNKLLSRTLKRLLRYIDKD